MGLNKLPLMAQKWLLIALPILVPEICDFNIVRKALPEPNLIMRLMFVNR